MTAARNAKPVPASITVSVFASAVRGTTSPRPSVKNVVPLMYISDQNPGAPPPPSPATRIAEPAAHCSRPKENTLPTAQRASNRINESGPKIERNTSRLRPDNALAAARPTPLAQAGPPPARPPATGTAAAVNHAEGASAPRRRLPTSPEGILGGQRCARRRCDAAREDARLVPHGRGGLVALARSGDDESQGYRAKIHTIPPWLVCRAMSGMKSAGGRTSAGSSDRTSPESRNQSPPIPA